ncbi:hypothetical protein G7Y79_00059g091770 [Physcia stellaris]|nr:hypothetical protein G7Y79_00059g091770 [Physcia stellaris]
MHCPEVQKRADPEIAKAEILKAKQRLQVLRQRRAQREAIEAARPIPTPRDIGIFDPTLICDIQEFDLYSQVTGFLQHLERQQSQHQYRKSDVLALLPKCLRGPAFVWFNSQSSFTTIQDFGRGLACAFPTTSLEPAPKTPNQSSTTPASHPPPQYHSCVECSAQFSSLSRLLEHTKQENACSRAVCKHCEQGFNSKNKLHEHIREQHTQKSNTNSNLRSPTPESMYKTKEKPAVCPPAPLAPPTPPATPKPISYPASISPKCSHLPIATPNITPKQAEIAAMLATRGFTPKRAEIAAFNCPLAPPTSPATSKPISWPASISEPVSPKCSSLPIATHRTTPESMEKLPASLTPSASPPRTPVLKHQKPYLTIDDLIRMFRGKPRPFGLHSHQKRRPSPRSPGTLYQSRITAYFLPAANQKAPISQGLKSSNPKSFQQPTPAETIRPALPEKSAISPYKKSGISYTSLQSRSSFLQSRFSFAWSRSTSPPASPSTSPPSFRSRTPDHVCCICFGHFSFRNGLFNYPRSSQRYPSNRRPMRGGRDG